MRHSKEGGRWEENSAVRCEMKASQIIKINRRTATNETNEPMEERTFHFIKTSG